MRSKSGAPHQHKDPAHHGIQWLNTSVSSPTTSHGTGSHNGGKRTTTDSHGDHIHDHHQHHRRLPVAVKTSPQLMPRPGSSGSGPAVAAQQGKRTSSEIESQSSCQASAGHLAASAEDTPTCPQSPTQTSHGP